MLDDTPAAATTTTIASLYYNAVMISDQGPNNSQTPTVSRSSNFQKKGTF
jgi:hypothetical protein